MCTGMGKSKKDRPLMWKEVLQLTVRAPVHKAGGTNNAGLTGANYAGNVNEIQHVLHMGRRT